MANSDKSNFLQTALWIAANVVATVGIVFVNKIILTRGNFGKITVSLTVFHFCCTTLSLFVASKFQLFTPKWLELKNVLPLCAVFCGYIVFSNYSLEYSAVVVYQVSRILVTPTVAMINFIFFKKSLDFHSIFMLLTICIGVGLATALPAIDKLSSTTESDFTFLIGLFFCLLAVITCSLYTIWVSVFSQRYECSSMQLLFNQAPLSAIMLAFLIPVADRFNSFEAAKNVDTLLLILLSGTFASVINISQFFIIIGTSPLSSTVVGHAKTCIIIAIGWLLNGVGSLISVLGVLMAVVGMIVYSLLQNNLIGETAIKRQHVNITIVCLLFLLLVMQFYDEFSYLNTMNGK